MFYYLDDFMMIIGLVILSLIYLFVFPLFISARVKRLEKKLDFLLKSKSYSPKNFIESVENQPETPIPRADYMAVLDQEPSSSISQTEIRTNEPDSDSGFFHWLGQDTLVKVGALLLILAFAWFVSYAFANNWIGPVGRITLGLLFGAGVMVFGVMRMRTQPNIGSIFTVVGSTITILTITSAQYIYEMFPPMIALAIIFLVVLFITFVSLQHERKELAYASLVTALLAPFLVNSQTGEPLLLMFYLLLVVAGTLAVVWRLRAESITLLALIGVLIYTAVAYDLDTGVALLFSFVFTGIFFITNIVSLIRRYTTWVSPIHVITALLTGLYLIGSILASAPEEWMSTYLLFWALIFAYGSYQVYIRTLNKIPFYIYASISVILIGTATIVELDGAVLTIVLTLEALAGIVLMSRIRADHKTLNLATALLLVPGTFTIEHFDSYSRLANHWVNGDVINSDFFAILVFIIALVIAGMERNNLAISGVSTGLLELGQKFLYGLASICGAALLWQMLHIALPNMIATMLAMIIYSLVGLVLYITGKTQGDSALKRTGVVILVLVVLRLLFVDVWTLEMAGRIITFLVIGLLFMSTAFLPKLKAQDN